MIIARYLTRELIKTTLAVLCVLLLVGLSNEFVYYLGKAAEGELSATFVLKLVLLNIPILLGMLLPIAFFVGILLCYGHLSSGSELTVLFACGFGLKRLLKQTFFPTIALMLIALLLNFWWAPQAMQAIDGLVARAQADLITRLLQPGRFQLLNDGRIFFVEKISSDHQTLRGLFMAAPQADDPSRWQIITAQSATIQTDNNINKQYWVMQQGMRYAGVPNEKAIELSQFARYGIQEEALFGEQPGLIAPKTFWELWQSDDQQDQAELAWRIALPFSICVVAFLAVPLSLVKPRQGKYAALLPGVVVIILYCNLLILGRALLQDEITPNWLGLWWVQGIGLLVGLLLCLKKGKPA